MNLSIDAINKHLEDEQDYTINEFCDAAKELLATNASNVAEIEEFRSSPLDSGKVKHITFLLDMYGDLYDSADARALALWGVDYAKLIETTG